MPIIVRPAKPWFIVTMVGLALVAGSGGPVAEWSPAVSASEETTVAIGESNDSDQRAELLDVFGVPDSASVIEVTVGDTLSAWDGIFDLTGVDSAYSSTALTCTSSGSGVAVSTRNIEVIPPELYALTMITAGLTDVELVVAAPDDAPALGMTALTGIFMTADQSPCAGRADDPERRDLALRELALVAGIGEANGGPDGVRAMSSLVLALQQAVVTGQMARGDLDAGVAALAEDRSVALTSDERAEVTGFLSELADAGIAWGAFATGWTIDQASETQVVVRPDAEGLIEAVATVTVPAGVGGAVSPVDSAPRTVATMPVQATQVPSPPATPTVGATTTMVATVVAAPVGDVRPPNESPADTGRSWWGRFSDLLSPWWLLLALIPLTALLVPIARRRRGGGHPLRFRRPATAVESLAHRRAVESAAVTAVLHDEPSMRPAQRPAVIWKGRLRRVDTP